MAHSTILDRFRPVGAPGPVGPAGVPTTEDTGPQEELLPVFRALAPDVEAARRVVEQAEKDAADALARARAEASSVLARAQQDAHAARAEAAARVTRMTSDRDEALLSRAREEAEALARARRPLIAEMTRTVIDRMLTEWRAT